MKYVGFLDSKNRWWYIFSVALILKSFVFLYYSNTGTLNPDEESNYHIAQNFLDGNGYTLNGKLKAFHGSFTVFVYQFLIDYQIPKSFYVITFYFIFIAFFLVSIWYFYRLLKSMDVPDKVSIAITLVYTIYPSALYYIGRFFFYENMTTPLLVIIFYYLFRELKCRVKSRLLYLMPVLIMLSCLFRGQMLFIYFIVFAVFFLYLLWKDSVRIFSFRTIYLYSVTFLLLGISHIPIFIKNKKMFGDYILSTQVGFELMQGHNEIARGSWYGNWFLPDHPYYKFSKKVLPDYDDLNEYEESLIRKDYALNWIRENPLKELELVVRKTAIYFLPRNYEGGYNLLNIVVHGAFLFALVLSVIKKQMNWNSILLLSPFIGSFLLSQIFFVGYRWRYYAEPFFILFAVYQIFMYYKSRKVKIQD